MGGDEKIGLPFPLTVTGVMLARFWVAAVGVAAAEAARTAAMAKVFMMGVWELKIITVGRLGERL
jgi:hypothetical protein